MSDIVEKAKDIYKNDVDCWYDNYQKSKDDLHFLSDDLYAQWDEKDYSERVRSGRPALTIDKLSQFIHQTANDIRMNTPSIGVIPANDKASQDTAEVFKGLIREIEYYSNADDVYDTASLNAIRCGIGFIRVDFEYEDYDGFDQRLCIKRVVNPLSVYIDSNSIECDGRDAKHGFVIESMSVKKFKEEYPDKAAVSFDAQDRTDIKEGNEEMLSIAEYFVIDEEKRTIKSDDGKASREITEKTVRRYKLSGADVLEESTFPGKYIPIIPVYGEEAWIDGKRKLLSLIRKAKPAQQLFNYWKSLETELLQKSPQAPFIAAVGQVEDFKDDWTNPNKSMVLRYHPKDAEGNALPPPQRLAPPPVPTGVINASANAVEDIKSAMGIYNAGLGMISNETSGIAIQRRQQEGDVATFHFQDNLIRSITHLGRVLVYAIPEVYSTPRVIRILGMEDEPKDVAINGALAVDGAESIDLSQGRYDIRVKTGGSYTTRRQEAAEFLSKLINVSPEMMTIMGDLMFENMDFSGANVMAERMKKMVDPKFLDDENDPKVAALGQALQEAQAAMQAMQGEMERLQQELQNKQAEIQIKAKEVELKQVEMQLKQSDTSVDNIHDKQRLELEAYKAQREYEIEKEKIELDRIKTGLDKGIDPATLVPMRRGMDDVMAEFSDKMANAINQLAAINVASANTEQMVLESLNAPKRVIRDENGDIVGVERL